MAFTIQQRVLLQRPSFALIGLASQVAVAFGIVVLAVTGRWLSSPPGSATILGGAIGLWVVGTLWWRSGIRPTLILVDLWFVAYGILLVVLPSVPMGEDSGTLIDPGLREVILLMGGPLELVGALWVGFGLIGAIAVWRDRR